MHVVCLLLILYTDTICCLSLVGRWAVVMTVLIIMKGPWLLEVTVRGWDWEMVADICLLLMRYMHPWFAATGFNLLSIRGVVATFMLARTEMMETGLSQVRAKHVLASI